MKKNDRGWRQAIAVGLTLATISPAWGQDLPGDVNAGKQVAAGWCAACHRVDSNVGIVDGAPDFYSIANLPSTTALSLKVFLETSHDQMPNFRLTQRETDDVIAYILSLKKK
jgi:mono/diheme cytochrome c family protein